MQQTTDIEKPDLKDELSHLLWTKSNGRRKIYVKFKTDTDNFNIVVYRYRNKLQLRNNGIDLKVTEDENL